MRPFQWIECMGHRVNFSERADRFLVNRFNSCALLAAVAMMFSVLVREEK